MVILIATSYLANAQSRWQWGKRGGSPNEALTLTEDDEYVVDMATDPAGNVYLLSIVQQDGFSPVNVAGHIVTGWGDAGQAVENILITSFKCDGTYRWSKDIGTNNSNYPVAIKTDTLGGVYITGTLSEGSSTRHIDADTSWTSGSYQSMFLMKYDTAGHYKWFIYPQPDTLTELDVAFNPYTGVYDMDVDGGGNSYLLCDLEPGGYAGGSYVVTTEGTYILKYDKNGIFISGNHMQIINGYPGCGLLMKKNPQNERYYITVENLYGSAPSFGSISINHPMTVGCFNNSGSLLWLRQDTDPPSYYSAFGRPVIDKEDNVYLAGRASGSDTFNTYIMTNAGTYATAVPVIFKLDSNGNNIWGRNATINGFTNCNNITLNGSEVDIAGSYPGLLKWAGYADSLNLPINSDYHVFITRFNSNTGVIIGLDSAGSSSGINNGPTAMTSDKYGNFYVGGFLTDQLWVTLPTGIDTLTNFGGYSDFFVAKYGTANCTGAISLETPPEPGKFSITGIHVFPNPATDELNITGVPQATSYRLLSITGTTQMQGPLQEGSNSLPVQRLATGIYLLEMTGADGARTIVRVVKE